VVRVARDFTDAQGRVFCAGDLQQVLHCEKTDAGFVVSLLIRTLRLNTGDVVHDAILENAGNMWMQPVPSMACVRQLWEVTDLALSDAEEDEKMDDYIDQLEALRGDLSACEDWLDSPNGVDRPDCRSGPLTVRVFGRNHAITYWIRLLFAAVKVAAPDADGND
jgi:hypothetical protein